MWYIITGLIVGVFAVPVVIKMMHYHTIFYESLLTFLRGENHFDGGFVFGALFGTFIGSIALLALSMIAWPLVLLVGITYGVIWGIRLNSILKKQNKG